MTALLPLDFPAVFKRYWSDHMFVPVFKDVRKKFLSLSGRKGLTGVSYTVLCLLLAQTLDTMLDGYSGRSATSDAKLYEAVGYSRAFDLFNKTHYEFSDSRYLEIVTLVNGLQKESKEFATVVDSLLQLDNE